uniref:Uncharacterized protein n=1 Tax=Solanum lycopersicum TaxID=4081 RepID=A0A3Q7FJI2_SOLLC
MVSAARRARARYSASVEDRETLGCFFVHQEIRFGPKKMRNLDVDFLSFLSFAQFEYEKPRSSKSPGRMSKPRPRLPKMYLRMRFRQCPNEAAEVGDIGKGGVGFIRRRRDCHRYWLTGAFFQSSFLH